jgi:predicted RNase H-like nuclease (RuvC/YqgF family)
LAAESVERAIADRSAHEAALEQERDELRQQLESASAELARMSDVVSQLEDARHELDQLRSQTEEYHQQPYDRDETAALAEAEMERETLEAELELARRRAAELSDTVAAQKKQLDSDRAGWSEELQQLRYLLERKIAVPPGSLPAFASGQAATPQPAAVQPAAVQPAAVQPAASQPPASDPVVGSVLAQFAILQQDAARRRAKA